MPQVATIPEGLAPLGYKSVMAGNWLLSVTTIGNPDGREFSVSWFHDEPCNWWCEARFSVVDMLSGLTAAFDEF